MIIVFNEAYHNGLFSEVMAEVKKNRSVYNYHVLSLPGDSSAMTNPLIGRSLHEHLIGRSLTTYFIGRSLTNHLICRSLIDHFIGTSLH